MPTPTWWRPEIALAALLSGMLLSAGLDPERRAGRTAGQRRVLILAVAALSIAATEVLTLLGGSQPAPTTPESFGSGVLYLVTRVLVPLMVGLAAAFSLGGACTPRMSLGAALASWLGASAGIVLITMYDVSGSASLTDVQALELPLTIIGCFIGFALAAIGGWFGGSLRGSLLAEVTLAKQG